MGPVVDADRVVQMLTNQNSAFGHAKPKLLRFDLQGYLSEGDRIIIRDNPFLLMGKNLFQILAGIGNKRRSGLLRRYCEGSVVKGDPLLAEKFIRRCHRGDSFQPQFLRQAALPGTEKSFTTSPGLRTVGWNGLDIQLPQRPGNLSLATAIRGASCDRGVKEMAATI